MNIKQQDTDNDIYGYLQVISRRRRTVVLVAALVFSVMAGYAFLSPPIFQATALVSVDKVGSDISSPNASQDSDEGYFETQFKLITSETQLRRVYEDLKLANVEEFALGLPSLRKAVTVLPMPRTRLASVNVESKDPALAASIAGSLARAFVRKNLDNQLFMSKTVLGALQARTRDADARLVIESLPAVVNNKLIQDIKTQIFNSEAALADLRTRYTANYPAVLALQSRLEAMRRVRDHEMDNILGSLKTELSGQLRANNVRIVDEPTVPQRPVRPRKGLALILGLVGGLALGALAAFMLETFDQTIQTHQDVELRLGLPFLGLIPHTRREKGAKVYAPLVSSDVSPSSEAFRNLRTIVSLANKASNDPFLLVTSTVQAEGKSFVATNLAVALAQLGQKVLIIDGDLRRPNQHLNLCATAKLGLCDYLSGGVAEAGHVAQKTGIHNLEFVACGTRSKNPAELLNAELMAKFVLWARGRYSRVIVDCPPVFPVSDVLLWGRHVNSTIFIAHYGRTRVPLIQTACARLRVGGVRILGGVINGAKIGTTRYANGRYAEHY
ncbi:MAG: polysaccharide biosynthesis tyrosine autokinase [Elusimicrobia bacterium]|nr:polysaccharide biosynthesis tyrosine autokinase [Elusimicrobiota bacterium]